MEDVLNPAPRASASGLLAARSIGTSVTRRQSRQISKAEGWRQPAPDAQAT